MLKLPIHQSKFKNWYFMYSTNKCTDFNKNITNYNFFFKKMTQWPWPWKSIGFQILLRTKYVLSLVKIHWRMLILECSQECYGRTDGRTNGSVTISLRNFVGEGIKMHSILKYMYIYIYILTLFDLIFRRYIDIYIYISW